MRDLELLVEIESQNLSNPKILILVYHYFLQGWPSQYSEVYLPKLLFVYSGLMIDGLQLEAIHMLATYSDFPLNHIGFKPYSHSELQVQSHERTYRQLHLYNAGGCYHLVPLTDDKNAEYRSLGSMYLISLAYYSKNLGYPMEPDIMGSHFVVGF